MPETIIRNNNCEESFQLGMKYHHYVNTSYPLKKTSFLQYKVCGEKQQDAVIESQWLQTEEASLYFHIPFCEGRCKYCNYTVMDKWTQDAEDEYVSFLLKEIALYKACTDHVLFRGFDFGGGTPSILSIENLKKIMHCAETTFHIAEDTEYSIETTPAIAARNYEKMEALRNLGFSRISMGIQTVNKNMLEKMGRPGTKSIYEKAVCHIRKAGFQNLNIDIMYGFYNQPDEDLMRTVQYVAELNPEAITVYRMHYKNTKMEDEVSDLGIDVINHQYFLIYDYLIKKGYTGCPGTSIFSKNQVCGASDYLALRFSQGLPYLGIGLGAQSLGLNYLAFNKGSRDCLMEEYRQDLLEGHFPAQDLYELPERELIARMITAGFYFGKIDLAGFEKRFHRKLEHYFKEQIDYLERNGLIEQVDDQMLLTEKGGASINGVIALFYSEASLDELKEMEEV